MFHVAGKATEASRQGENAMRTIKGPGLFLAQFATDTPPHNTLTNIARWAKGYGYNAIQIPTRDRRFLDLDKAAESQTYCDEIRGQLAEIGLEISELSTHEQGQMVSVHPAYDAMFDGQCPTALRGNPEKRRQWAAEEVRKAATASRKLGLTEHVSFTGSLAWPYFYPYPQRPAGLIEECFAEQGRRWTPILDEFEENGVDLCFEIHPTEDVFDGDTFDMFLDAVGGHKRCNINYDASHLIKQSMDYLGFIDAYHDRIKMFHVKDAEFNPTAKQGVYGGYKGWLQRAGRDRSLGEGQVNFKAIFAKLAGYDFGGWAVYEWEDCLQHPEVAARKGAEFIANHIIQVTDRVFDDFAATGGDHATNLKLLGIKG
jgi:sugar phosphate isomerase/epimerase